MCGRYALNTSAEQLAREFDVDAIAGFESHRFNIAPSQAIDVIRSAETSLGTPSLSRVQWGLLPSWSKEKSLAYKLINARSETLSDKASFREAFKKRRCLIPATGFYEWTVIKNRKQPYFIFLKKQPLFAFAGLWEKWKSPEGEIIESACIITREAGASILSLHDRMPCIVAREFYQAWLNEPSKARSILQGPPVEFDFYPVSSRVNSPKNDDAFLIERENDSQRDEAKK